MLLLKSILTNLRQWRLWAVSDASQKRSLTLLRSVANRMVFGDQTNNWGITRARVTFASVRVSSRPS